MIPKGTYKALQAAGLAALRQTIASALPALADRVDTLTSWKQCSLLAVESSRVPRWYKPGLLLIGDAAHVMSPVGGVGINYAIQDAAVAANVLVAPFREHRLRTRDLAAIQRRREWPTRVIQTFQRLLQQRLMGPAMQAGQPFRVPGIIRLPLVQGLLARLVAYGVRRVRLAPAVVREQTPRGTRMTADDRG